jgi:putative SOS response-associated peptidase YedK
MCGRYVSATPPDQVAAYFGAMASESLTDPDAPVEPSYNVAPTNDVLVVVEFGAARALEQLRWGLVPFWAKDLRIGSKMINARAETLATKGAYKKAFTKQRCIIPADSFYEWLPVPGEAKRKQPIHLRPADDSLLAFAGLWDTWRSADGTTVVRSCTIITTAANEAVAKVHDRMPVILPPSAWDQWLDPTEHDLGALSQLLVPAPPELLVFEPVSTAVNTPRNKGPELIVPVDPGVDLGLP